MSTKIDRLERMVVDLEKSNDAMRSTVVALDAVAEELRTAGQADSDTVRLLAEAVSGSRDAVDALTRADAIRANALLQWHMPHTPPFESPTRS
jgi:hypothetical protein